MKARRLLRGLLLIILLHADSSYTLSISLLGEQDERTPFWAWKLTGPYGGEARRIATDPTDPARLYIGTNDGQLFQSLDGGESWQILLGFNQPGFCISEILVDVDNRDVIYVSGWNLFSETGGGIFRSRDRGRTWERLSQMQNHSVRALAQAASNHNVLVAGALDGVFRSKDRGETWERISPEGHAEMRNIESLAVDPRSDQVIYVGTWHLPWKTTDGGRTWFRTGGRENGIVDDSDVFSIVIDDSNPDVVLLSACTGIYRSVTGGKRWMRMSAVPSRSRRTLVLAMDPLDRRVIYAGTTEGLWRTTDGGVSWRLITSLRLVVQDIAVHPGNREAVYLATEEAGILISRNNGDTFEPSNVGFSNRIVRAVVPDREIKGRVYCGLMRGGAGGTFFISDDGGVTWRGQSLDLGDLVFIYQSKKDSSVLYIATSRGVYSSQDRGETWRGIPPPEGFGGEYSQDEGVLQLGEAGTGQRRLLALKRNGLFLFDEGSATWRRILGAPPEVKFASLFIGEAQTIFVGSTQGLMVSKNGGASWSHIPAPPNVGSVQAIIQHPLDESLIFIGTPVGLFRSKTGGKIWERCNRGLPMVDLISVTLRPDAPDEMIACDYRRGAVYLSGDRGHSWHRIDEVAPKSRVWMASFDPFDGNRIWVASSGAGVYLGLRQANLERKSSGVPNSA